MALFLIDGHAIAYRSYYAFIRNPLTNSRGENTSAVYGFLKTVLQLLERYNPEMLACVFDSEEETGRHIEYSEYKAHREEMPDDLSPQFPMITEMLEAMGIPVVIRPGYEADDIIATLARKAEKKDIDVRVVSGDKDLFQLLSDRIRIIRPGKGANLSDVSGPEMVMDRYGLRPDQVVDLLSLMGDSVDNIPGVKGIGEKTALKLLQEFGSLDELLDRCDEIEPAHIRKKVEAGRDDAMMSRELVTLIEVPLRIGLENLKVGDRDDSALLDLLLDLEFNQIIKELDLGRHSSNGSVDYSIVDAEGLRSLADDLTTVGSFALDTETTSLDPHEAELVGISFCCREGEAYYVPVESRSAVEESGLFGVESDISAISIDRVREHLGPVLENEEVEKTGHNIKYDLIVLEAHGLPVENVAWDTMIASYCIDPTRRSHSLDSLAIDHFRHRMIPYGELFEKGDRVKDIRTVSVERLAEYSCEDADYTWRLREMFEPQLEDSEAGELFNHIEMPLSFVLKRMEQEGMGVDSDKLRALSSTVAAALDRLTEQIYELAGETFNINSGKQLQHILFEKLGLPPVRKTKTGLSTDVRVLTELAVENPIAGLILEYRQLAKLAGTYIDSLPKLVKQRTGRIHTSFNQTVTATGRLSSSDPNLQNIPIRTELGRRIREAFVPREGCVLVDADYSQIELRIMAHLSNDPQLVEAFREGADIHTRTAARIFGVEEGEVSHEMRSRAKTINFGVMYGQGPRALSQQLRIPFDEAKNFIEEYFDKYPGIKGFIEGAKESARERGYAQTLFGRRRLLPEIDSGEGRLRSFAERIAVNMPIQGTAADIIKIAMIEIDRTLTDKDLGARMILQVHDELVFDVPGEEQERVAGIVREKMEAAADLSVPLVVEIGAGGDWLEAHR
jgi:DNA polymerase-1